MFLSKMGGGIGHVMNHLATFANIAIFRVNFKVDSNFCKKKCQPSLWEVGIIGAGHGGYIGLKLLEFGNKL